MTLDTYRPIETPEGVELGLRVAGPVPRAWAFLVDLLLRAVLIWVVAAILGVFGGAGFGLFLIFVFLLEWFYAVFFEVFRAGATPGKRIVDIQVVHDDGAPVGWTGSLLRNFLRFADMLPVAYGFGLISCLVSRDFKRLGDRVAGTVVVHRDRSVRLRKIPEAEPVAPPVTLDVEEQGALLDFTARATDWSEARAIEIADHLEPLTGATGRAGLGRVFGMASWFLGNR